MTSIHKPPTVSDDRRAKSIYRQAARVIYKKGFGATSMGDIADAVDLTKGGLYYYIKGKEALLFAIMDDAMEMLEAEVMQPASEQRDPELRLAALVSGHIRLMMQDPSALTILVTEEEGLDDVHRALVAERKDSYPRMLQECIEQILAKQGASPNVDPTVAAYSLFGMIHWVVRWYKSESALSEEQIVEQLTNLALYGIIPVSPAAGAKIA
ncbi:MAG: TetR/AcrR family transcriptional regulator [bacterium]|nr:TetR/AcrR family transcriptional regulator [bacterium]